MRGVDARVGEPRKDRVANKLRAVVRAQEARCAMRVRAARKIYPPLAALHRTNWPFSLSQVPV